MSGSLGWYSTSTAERGIESGILHKWDIYRIHSRLFSYIIMNAWLTVASFAKFYIGNVYHSHICAALIAEFPKTFSPMVEIYESRESNCLQKLLAIW